MSYSGKLGLERVDAGQPCSRKGSRPGVNCAKSVIKMNRTILQSDLYLNPDPLVRLIGEPNEAIVKIEGQKFDSSIDSGAQISQLTESLVKALDLKIWNLKEKLPLEGAAGIKVPYLGCVEARLEIPGVDAFNKDCLF